MSKPLETPWTEEEKCALLTEILKNARVVPSNHLFNMIREFNISPSWSDIPLPPGRTLNQCRDAFQSMYQQVVPANQTQPPPPRPGSWAPPPVPSAPVPVSTLAPTPAPAPTPVQEGYVPRKRPLYPLEKTALTPRAIQPRPPLSAGQFSSESGSPGSTSPRYEGVAGNSGERPRKRGRPSKAEAERRKAEAEARGEEYPPRRRSTTAKTRNPPTPSGAASATSEGSLLSPRAALHTPEMQKQELPSEDSGGKDPGQMDTSVRRTSESSVTGETDPVRGIIRSQTSQERRLPPPHEIQARQGSFISQTQPREPFIPPRALEASLGGSPSPGQGGGIHRSAADLPSIPQAEKASGTDTGGAIQSISNSGETKKT
ncbi:hypothetical protein VTN77DRAFT_868 [Rasamsonia byssochlamydoides]|uniref:uncharacterized protein n=1 Tax=Rasamsonia byssochlamydoides TaxID=89139 RepID=UPI003742A2D7